jgi:hypothetical protein
MLLAEDLLLLVTGNVNGRLSVPSAQVDAGLGGANLIELTMMSKVDLSAETDQGKPGRIIVRDPSPVGDDILDAAMGTLIKRAGGGAHRPAARAQVRTQDRRSQALPPIQAAAQRMGGEDRRRELGSRGRPQGDPRYGQRGRGLWLAQDVVVRPDLLRRGRPGTE